MDTVARTIDHLDKVTLRLSASSAPGQDGSETKEAEASMIYGIGVEGVTPFEKMLFGKSVGDQLSLSIENSCGDALLGHLRHIFFNQIEMKPPLHLEITIVGIQRAESREVVQAMAKLASGCNSGCDCGCGCG